MENSARTADAVLRAAISSVVAHVPKTEPGTEDFLESSSFRGARPGFYFSAGPKGTGYYADPKQANARSTVVPKREAKPQADPDKLLEEAENLAGDQLDLADGKGVRRSVLAFVRKYKANMEMRMKHADAPERFLDSEVDLDEAIQQLMGMAGLPDLYTEIAGQHVVPTILALLQHDNSDIAADAIQLLKELTDADARNDADEEAEQLVTAMLEANALELLVQRMGAFNDRTQDDDATAVFSALNIIENLVEVNAKVADMVCERTKIMKWLLGRVRQREFDSVKQYASEVLAILVQDSSANRKRLVDGNGIDVLLQAVAPYKNRDPASADEVEHLGDLMGIVCSCLQEPQARSTFLAAEGIELMLLIIKQKRTARTGALKALDYALVHATPACERFVDVQGLRALFPLFMGKLKMRKAQIDEGTEEEEEACCVSIVCNLLLGLQRGSRRDRVAAKFVENEFEKCDRLLEIFTRRSARVAAAEARIENPEDVEDELEDEPLALRLAAGLFTVQQAGLIVANLWHMGDPGMQKRLLQLLHQQGLSMSSVRAAAMEYLSGGEGADSSGLDAAQAAQQRAFVRGLLPGIGHSGAIPAHAPAPPPPPPAPDAPDLEAAPPLPAEEDVFGLEGLDALPPSTSAVEPPAADGTGPHELQSNGHAVQHPDSSHKRSSKDHGQQHRGERDKQHKRSRGEHKEHREHKKSRRRDD